MKRVKCLVLITVVVVSSFSYGLIAGVYKLFPFELFHSAKVTIFGVDERVKLLRSEARASMFLEFSSDAEIAMIGDSITEAGAWGEFFPAHSVVNRGVGGDTTSKVIDRFATIESASPEISFVMVGINDLRAGESPSKVADNISKIIELLQGIDSKVVLQTTLECSRSRCGRTLQDVRKLNEILTGFSSDFDIQLIDINVTLGDENGLRSEYTYDGIHLNGRGYRAWVDSILSHELV
jgi:lysophospholipase L1-like esterase